MAIAEVNVDSISDDRVSCMSGDLPLQAQKDQFHIWINNYGVKTPNLDKLRFVEKLMEKFL